MIKKLIPACIALAILGVAIGVFLAHQLEETYSTKEPAWETSVRVLVDPRSLFPEKDHLTILVLGTDYNYTRQDIMYTKNSRSDTMILGRISFSPKAVKLLSIPRDTRVTIPGDGPDKINNAFAIGGTKLAETVVQNLTQIPIDYYVRIKEEGLKNFVNAMGGIDLNVEKDMNYDDRWGHLHIHLKKGFQHLDGEKTAEYSRFRHDPEGDYARIRRQQIVVQAIEKRLENPTVLTHLPEIVRMGRQNIETDLSLSQLMALVNLLKDVPSSSVSCLTLPTVPKDLREGGYWVSYVILAEEEAKLILTKFLSDELPAPVVPGPSNPPR